MKYPNCNVAMIDTCILIHSLGHSLSAGSHTRSGRGSRRARWSSWFSLAYVSDSHHILCRIVRAYRFSVRRQTMAAACSASFFPMCACVDVYRFSAKLRPSVSA